MKTRLLLWSFIISSLFYFDTHAQIVPVGQGSYTTTFPGPAVQGRREQPRGLGFGTKATPKVSSNLDGIPVPTNDWWSTLLWTTYNSSSHGWGFYAYPLSYRSKPDGLAIEYTIPISSERNNKQPMSEVAPIIIGVEGLGTSESLVDNFSDWTVTAAWFEGNHNFKATIGMAMPFTYFEKSPSEVASVKLNFPSPVTIQGNILIIEENYNGADYAVYGPEGTTWTKVGNSYTSNLNGKTYWSIAHLPEDIDIQTAVNELKQYAYVFPKNTTVNWQYNDATATMTTNFNVEVDVKEGLNNQFLLGLLPHQWGNLPTGAPALHSYSYPSVRGEIKSMVANSYTIDHKFQGILPTLPNLGKYSDSYSQSELYKMVDDVSGGSLATWTDSYNDGKKMNRLAQLAHIADQLGNETAKEKLVTTVKERIEDWLSAESDETDFIMYYDEDWKALLGFPAGHGQDYNLNDHHFHWGYFIHMAAMIEQYEPGWADQWGEMVNLLVRDASAYDHNDEMFPYLRNFSPYAGHCWANGSSTDPNGNDQESSSESMQFHSALIHWGEVTGNKEIRDLGIYLYTTELSAIEEYWWDVNDRTFQPELGYEAVSRIWGAGYDAETFWTLDIGPMWGINFLPIHGGSLYLGYRPELVQTLWDDITANTGILNREQNPNIWYDIYWMYLSFVDPEKALGYFEGYQDYSIEFGESKAHTYYWLHNMVALGQVDVSITANHPIASVFDKNGDKTYVAHNYSNQTIMVTYSDGTLLEVPARSTATSKDVPLDVAITNPFNGQKFPTDTNITLNATVERGTPDKVEFYDGETLLGTTTSPPYSITLPSVQDYVYNYNVRAYIGNEYKQSKYASVQVGLGIPQDPYAASPATIPGTLFSGQYDQGGQNVAYYDVSPYNEGDARTDEYVDVSVSQSEGLSVGWIDKNEWLEYTINATQTGMYDVEFKVASGLSEGGGPLHLEVDEVPLGTPAAINYTGDWGAWQSVEIKDIPITQGEHIIRLVADGGGFNLGRFTFTRIGEITDQEAPTTPENLTVTNKGVDYLTIAWDAATDNIGISGYQLSLNGAVVTTVNNLNYTFNGLTDATNYTISVVAIDNTNNTSIASTLTETTLPIILDEEPPTEISRLAIENVDVATLSLSWSPATDNIGVVGYQVFSNGNLLAQTNDTLVSLLNLSPSTNYVLEVIALDASGNTSAAVSVTVTTLDDVLAPEFTSAITLQEATQETLTISWAAASDNVGVAGYEIYLDGVFHGSTVDLNYSFSGLLAETTYAIEILASDFQGNVSTPLTNTFSTNPLQVVCTGGSDNNDYTYEVSNEDSNPTITFIPSRTGVGSTTVLLYYKVNNGGLGGYIVSANSPYTINANADDTIEFYYTYSVPEGGERNTAATPHTVTIGECGGSSGGGNDIQAPTSPLNLLASNITTNSASITWSASTDNIGVVGYDIVVNGSISSTTGTQTTLNELTENTVYTVNVIAKDIAGNTSVAASTTFTTLENSTGGETGNCSGNDANGDYTYELSNVNGKTAITFIPSRSGVANSTLIVYYAGSAGAGHPGYFFTTNTAHPTTIDAGDDIHFYFTYNVPEGGERNTAATPHLENISNCNNNGGGNEGDTEVPSSPSNLSATAVTTSSFTISWSASSDNIGVVGYDIYLDNVFTSSTTSTSYSFSQLVDNTTYSIKIVAKDAAGNTNENAISITTNADNSNGGNYTCDGDAGFTTASTVDYYYTVAYEGNNVIIGFEPQRNGVGSSTRLLIINGAGYHMDNDGDGTYSYTVQNTSSVDFYFVYNVPEGGERNGSTAMHTCSSSGSRYITLEDDLKDLSLSIYPNPAQHQLHLDFTSTVEDEDFEIRIINLGNGQVKEMVKSTSLSNTFNVSDYSSGIYLIEITSAHYYSTKKWIKQ
ncbi:glycosyl hydrolase [Flammeovirga kamogawensis]|uniref:glucan endo-1,3-beta-D-glucosidase n=1 Tax=Flammeovirga kamogawensis TaxID=373891 RepID=A0ABX8GZU2_9BACT|nr:glycosyl hydrolase [Flammeovirga kamogawensis]MBB6459314.1 endoglucanase Acf2/chitodextrinase [Flammeovirga kamogawensis]QWG08873.1 fibronectin type III domain-containing protein [Flammeovirga kamogawensis]TRX67163.1 T9SS type A sorting domain-containing protein [Flammeovirga kamogawensis]